MTCDTCRQLLSNGLDLCVRARKMDAQERADEPVSASPVGTRSGTIALWVQDQYEKDLAEWERKARHHLTQGCA